MVSLDISTWSLVIFVAQALSLLTVLFLMAKPFIKTILITIIFWITSQILFIVYGYDTGQIGFVILGLFNLIASIIAAFAQVGQDDEEEE